MGVDADVLSTAHTASCKVVCELIGSLIEGQTRDGLVTGDQDLAVWAGVTEALENVCELKIHGRTCKGTGAAVPGCAMACGIRADASTRSPHASRVSKSILVASLLTLSFLLELAKHFLPMLVGFQFLLFLG